MGERGHVILTQLATLVLSYSIEKRSMAGSSREFFDDTILEFLGETSEASEDDIDALFEALPLDWETTPPASAPPLPAIGQPHTSFAHATLQDLERLRAKT